MHVIALSNLINQTELINTGRRDNNYNDHFILRYK